MDFLQFFDLGKDPLGLVVGMVGVVAAVGALSVLHQSSLVGSFAVAVVVVVLFVVVVAVVVMG